MKVLILDFNVVAIYWFVDIKPRCNYKAKKKFKKN